MLIIIVIKLCARLHFVGRNYEQERRKINECQVSAVLHAVVMYSFFNISHFSIANNTKRY